MYLRTSFVCLLVAVSSLVSAQSGTEGVITYSAIQIDGVPDPKTKSELVYSFKGQQSRLDLSAPEVKFSFIYDNSKSNGVRVQDKSVTAVTGEDILIFQDCAIRESKITKEKKTIAGVSCTKTIFECVHPSNESIETIEVWVAESLKLPAKTELIMAGVSGVPMEFDFKYAGTAFHLVATKVEMKAVSADVMKFPAITPEVEDKDGQSIKIEEKVIEVK